MESPQSPDNDERTFIDDHSDDMTDGSVSITVVIEQEVTRSTPHIVSAVLSVDDLEMSRDLSNEEKLVVKELQELGDWLNDKIEDAFRPLREAPCRDRYEQFVRITTRLFHSGINWGRIAILFAMSVKFIAFCGKEYIQKISAYLIGFITTKLLFWIVESGGWKAVNDYANEVIQSHCPKTEHMVIITFSVFCLAGIIYNTYLKK